MRHKLYRSPGETGNHVPRLRRAGEGQAADTRKQRPRRTPPCEHSPRGQERAYDTGSQMADRPCAAKHPPRPEEWPHRRAKHGPRRQTAATMAPSAQRAEPRRARRRAGGRGQQPGFTDSREAAPEMETPPPGAGDGDGDAQGGRPHHAGGVPAAVTEGIQRRRTTLGARMTQAVTHTTEASA